MKFLFFLMLTLVGCATTTPTNYELNRRSGLGVDQDREDFDEDEAVAKEVSYIRTGTARGRVSKMPARVPAVIAKVWVYEQIINKDQWLQGTWLFLEVEKERWLPQVDTGYGNFINRGPVGVRKTPGGHNAKP